MEICSSMQYSGSGWRTTIIMSYQVQISHLLVIHYSSHRLKWIISVLKNRFALCCAEMWNSCLFGPLYRMCMGVYYVFISWISNSMYIILRNLWVIDHFAVTSCRAWFGCPSLIQEVFNPFLSCLCYSSASGNIVHFTLYSLGYWEIFSYLWEECRVEKVFVGFNSKPLCSLAHFQTREFYCILILWTYRLCFHWREET